MSNNEIYKLHRYKHKVGWSFWHFQWCTKYRRKIFSNSKDKNLCKILLYEIAKKHNFEILDCEVDTDHVHVIASLPITFLPSTAVQYLKGGSSRGIFLLSPHLRKFFSLHKNLWSHGNFIGSVGHITLEKAKQYVEDHYGKFKLLLCVYLWNLRSETK